MPEITCDYMVPMTVRVNTDTGEVDEIWLHLESFQSSMPGRFLRATDEVDLGPSICLRQAYLDTDEESGEKADGESVLGDKALAIADRVTLKRTEIQLTDFTLDDVEPQSLQEQFRESYPEGVAQHPDA